MAAKKKYFMCHSCEKGLCVPADEVSRLEDNELMYLCPNCDDITIPVKFQNDWAWESSPPDDFGPEDYLSCCTYKGPLSKEAVGYIDTGTEKLYIDANGRRLTRQQFIDKHGKDPFESILERMDRQKVYNVSKENAKKSRSVAESSLSTALLLFQRKPPGLPLSIILSVWTKNP